ncbi:hypothetical protein PT110_09660, partial [Erysipelothrix rhusiopathiae]|nr:hypothetical protein [Erysipelothrix rhusiopathiae]
MPLYHDIRAIRASISPSKDFLKPSISAELVIVVFDASRARDQEDIDLLEATKHKERIIVYNKKDLVN